MSDLWHLLGYAAGVLGVVSPAAMALYLNAWNSDAAWLRQPRPTAPAASGAAQVHCGTTGLASVRPVPMH